MPEHVDSTDEEDRREMFGEARDRGLDTVVDALPDIEGRGKVTLAQEDRSLVKPVRVGYRSSTASG
ncbi:hypothetical protein [Kitasatospora sp. NPDC094015]|uniref:hypothetical protein n=1 Tax=Kitasatospora sp. NPDC094015 TaxID=3155205 RepID=UPI00332EC899